MNEKTTTALIFILIISLFVLEAYNMYIVNKLTTSLKSNNNANSSSNAGRMGAPVATNSVVANPSDIPGSTPSSDTGKHHDKVEERKVVNEILGGDLIKALREKLSQESVKEVKLEFK